MQRRKQLGINQSELAEQIGLSEHQISNIETGRSYPRMKSFIKICEILEANADYFISGSMKDEVDQNIIDMVTSCTPEEQQVIWKLLDAYIHREDDTRIFVYFFKKRKSSLDAGFFLCPKPALQKMPCFKKRKAKGQDVFWRRK